MARKFKSEEEKKAWAEKMKEARMKKKLEKQTQAPKEQLPPPPEGKVWILHQSGDKLLVPEWLAEDLIRRRQAKRI